MRRSLYLPPLSLGIIVLLGILALFITPALAPVLAKEKSGELEVFASGLDQPRGLNFGPDGALYVTEAGRGGKAHCFFGPNFWTQCFGPTGAVTRIDDPGQKQILKALSSSGSLNGDFPDSPHRDGWFADGPSDISLLDSGDAYITLGGGPAEGPGFRRLIHMSASGQELGSVGIEGNVYAVLSLDDRRIVVNAGLNEIIEVDADGNVALLATFPRHSPEAVPPEFSFIQDLDSVPTTVTLGPDGALYVGELTGFPFVPGAARIYRIPEGHNPADLPPVFLEGFSHIIDIAFGEDGTLYVLEMAAETLRDAFDGTNYSTGDLVRVDNKGKGKKREILASGLTMPAGIALGSSGDSIYISNCGVCVGTGEVLRLELD